jgi:pimeloyl-ACP methyl ester carboxylesterase
MKHQSFTRRQVIQSFTAFLALYGLESHANEYNFLKKTASINHDKEVEKLNQSVLNQDVAYGKSSLSTGIRSRFIKSINGLNMHILEAGFVFKNRPCVLLLHGFPELAYSWRKTMIPLAKEGYHVIAPDLRGYGRTTGWDNNYDCDLRSYSTLNQVKDVLSLVFALGLKSVKCVVGHDFGSPLAAWCSVIRPDVFQSVVLMSAPFSGTPKLPFNTANQKKEKKVSKGTDIHADLAALKRPRKHYQLYYTTREANDNMQYCSQGVHDFLRAYFHFKSADWEQNKPFRLQSWSAGELAKLPTYYIMDLDQGMAETVAEEMPTAEEIAACEWLTDEELKVFSSEFERTGFQGGLNRYRSSRIAEYSRELQVFSGRTIDVPSCFIAGASDWGVYQRPESFDKMKNEACTRMKDVYLIDNAGHWVQQEQPQKVSKLLIGFLNRSKL